jgi:anti-sigma B factor antagonist
MDIEITRLPTQSLMSIRGEIDLATAPQLHDALDSIDSGLGVVVDLTQVTFLDSSGLSELVKAHELHPGGVRLVVATPAIHRVLDVSGLLEVFSIYETVDDATREP